MTGRFNPKTFAQPDYLRSIQPVNLVRLLEPSRKLLEDRGFLLPLTEPWEMDYLKLSVILAEPDEFMDSHVIEGLHVISNLGIDENFDELLDIARRNFVDVDLDATAADLAARIWNEVPQALEMKEREAGTHRRRKFESLRAQHPDVTLPPEKLPTDYRALESDLESWFAAKRRGIGCRVVRTDTADEVRFLVQHGQPCKREPSRKGAESTCTFFRPEKTDLVIYDFIHNELRISTSTIGELKLYRAKFGEHLFGSPDYFVYAPKYTLLPLREGGSGALKCRDIWGLESARLTEIEYATPGPFNVVERIKAEDVLGALDHFKRRIPPASILLRARFAVKIAGEASARPVMIQPPSIAEFGRGEESALIEQWLRARGFVLEGKGEDDEDSQPFMAVA